jgi:hypothetical protein
VDAIDHACGEVAGWFERGGARERFGGEEAGRRACGGECDGEEEAAAR